MPRCQMIFAVELAPLVLLLVFQRNNKDERIILLAIITFNDKVTFYISRFFMTSMKLLKSKASSSHIARKLT